MEQLVRITKLAGIVALCAGSSALIACGGSSPPKAATQPAVVAQHPRQTAPASGLDTGRPQSRRADGQPTSAGSAGTPPHSPTHTASGTQAKQPDVSRGRTVQKGHSTPALSGDDHHPITASGPNPCRLVRLGEAKAITGGAIAASTEAPLGPTCVYKLTGSKANITLDVEAASVSRATSHMTGRQQVTVHGRRGYCGTLGTSMLYVPLGNGQILHVTAPCMVAQRFAALALGRLAA